MNPQFTTSNSQIFITFGNEKDNWLSFKSLDEYFDPDIDYEVTNTFHIDEKTGKYQISCTDVKKEEKKEFDYQEKDDKKDKKDDKEDDKKDDKKEDKKEDKKDDKKDDKIENK
jgi:hypothetical protein